MGIAEILGAIFGAYNTSQKTAQEQAQAQASVKAAQLNLEAAQTASATQVTVEQTRMREYALAGIALVIVALLFYFARKG